MKKILVLSLLVNWLHILNTAEQMPREDNELHFNIDLDLSELTLALETLNKQVTEQQTSTTSILPIQQLINQEKYSKEEDQLCLINLNIRSLLELNSISYIQKVRHLDISHNQLEIIDPNFLINVPALEWLQLIFNKLQKIKPGIFINLPFLKTLYLSYNKLEKIEQETFVNLPMLKELSLSNNKLKEIELKAFINLPALEDLNLSHNTLQKIEPKSFIDLQHLKVLYLSHNQLQTLELELFTALPSLKWLYLSYNRLKKDIIEQIINYCQKGKIYLEIDNQSPLPSTGYFTKAALRESEKSEQTIHSDT